MRFPDVSEIRRIRKSLDLTQMELSEASGISQSAIAKIESGTVTASYASVVRLFETLDDFKNAKNTSVKAMDVASRSVTTVQIDQTVLDASQIMQDTGYSQLPVLNGEAPVGSISEKSIFRLLEGGVTRAQLRSMPVSEVMGDTFPVISYDTPISAITGLIYDMNAVLVLKTGRIVGMITNADLLKLI